MNTLYLIRGLPGSGKSTLARKRAVLDNDASLQAVHLEADMYQMKKGVYVFDGDRVGLSHVWCQQTTRIFLNNGYNVYVSNTFTTQKEIQYYRDIANEVDVPLIIFSMQKQYGNIHNVPEEVLEKMRQRWVSLGDEEILV